ncbi:MAG TPA: gluconate 2-dehydrogenase subunit 3 family protein [Candidatus Acidoferrales bacterium]|nr:gluconate 2-dehydrogenase subunit 3 family protein [Candidatus Acidoferrales bacterium]
MTKRSRRAFLVESGAGLSAAWLAANWPGILEAKEHASRAAAGLPIKLDFFSEDQAAEVDAITAQIIPADDTPGAHEARCVYFIDRSLATFLKDSQPVYAQGLKDLQAKTSEMFSSATRFSALTSDQQIQLLTAIEKTPFFTAVRNHTVLGMFSNPVHGGNYNNIGWKMIGYDNALNWKPPFGYYDDPNNAS